MILHLKELSPGLSPERRPDRILIVDGVKEEVKKKKKNLLEFIGYLITLYLEKKPKREISDLGGRGR